MEEQQTSSNLRGHRSTMSDTTHLTSFSRPKFHTGALPESNSTNTTPNTSTRHHLNKLKEHEVTTGFFDNVLAPHSACAASFALSTSTNNTLSLSRIPSNTESLPSRRTSPKLRVHSKLSCPENVEMISASEASQLLKHMTGNDTQGGLPNVLILDTRPFQDYCKSHMVNAINLSLPSTLSRRPTFTLDKCVETLTSEERVMLQTYINTPIENQPSILIYDNVPTTKSDVSPAVYHLAKKFTSSGRCKTPIYILENGYQTFEYTFHDLIATGSYTSHPSKNSQSDADTSLSSINETFSPNSAQVHSPQSLTSNGSMGLTAPPVSNNTSISRSGKSPLALSRFTLPDVSHLSVFKARHNEELMNGSADSTLHLQSQLSPSTLELLPDWLSNVYGSDLGATELSKKFNSIQIQERERLNSALTHGKSFNSSPKVSSGFELGRKNRYKDILPYEHSRVKIKPYKHENIKLPLIQTLKIQNKITDEQSYINASYLHYPSSKFHYIATQGPLAETVGDFWKVVNDHKVPLILSLTPEIENYVEKCAPYWVPGHYISNDVDISVEIIEELFDVDISAHTDPKRISENNGSVTLRHFKIQVGSLPPLHTLQIHITTWPDHGILVNSEALLGLVSLKTYIMKKLTENCNVGKDRPIVVHCSAGSGRTGCFCCVDTAIDILLNDKTELDEDGFEDPITPASEFVGKSRDKDLIYNITSSFRTQRVAVVQNLRQYILIYDTLLSFLEIKSKATQMHLLTPNGSFGHFINGDIFTANGLVDWEYKVNNIANEEGQFIGNFLRKWY